MNHTAMAGTPATDKAEKTRQSLASLQISYIYQYIAAGIISVFVVRYAVRSAYQHARQRSQASSDVSRAGKESDDDTPRRTSTIVKVFKASDAWASRSVGVWPLGANTTWIQLILTTIICAVNIESCLVIATALINPATAKSNVARAFSRRCGRIATANYPLLFAMAGRSNPVSLFTGIGYQQIRFYHKVIGRIVVLESVIHTLGYTGYYIQSLGIHALAEEATEMYFTLGIFAMVGLFVIYVSSLAYVKNRWYEVFLGLHIVGAVATLVGSWYHRPIMQDWVMAAVGFWVFERLFRLSRHFYGRLHRQFIPRSPILKARASVASGAILLTVPFPHGAWEAGQHVYVSFWGLKMLKKPWTYGQSHPLSIFNIPSQDPTDPSGLQLVFKVHDGITKSLAAKIVADCASSGEKTVELSVSIEGPYGKAPIVRDYGTILLIGGGSGITHVGSVLYDIVEKIKAGTCAATQVRLVWAVQQLEQTEWLQGALQSIRDSTSSLPHLDLKLDIYVTRHEFPSGSSSQESLDEKKGMTLPCPPGLGGATIHLQRPEIAEMMHTLMGETHDNILVVACGPPGLEDVVRLTGRDEADARLHTDIPSFQT